MSEEDIDAQGCACCLRGRKYDAILEGWKLCHSCYLTVLGRVAKLRLSRARVWSDSFASDVQYVASKHSADRIWERRQMMRGEA